MTRDNKNFDYEYEHEHGTEPELGLPGDPRKANLEEWGGPSVEPPPSADSLPLLEVGGSAREPGVRRLQEGPGSSRTPRLLGLDRPRLA